MHSKGEKEEHCPCPAGAAKALRRGKSIVENYV
jgi:hypothetical protein